MNRKPYDTFIEFLLKMKNKDEKEIMQLEEEILRLKGQTKDIKMADKRKCCQQLELEMNSTLHIEDKDLPTFINSCMKEDCERNDKIAELLEEIRRLRKQSKDQEQVHEKVQQLHLK